MTTPSVPFPQNKRFVNLIGRSFGRWSVIDYLGTTPRRMSKWLCRCSCGNVSVCHYASLASGQSKSCGCLRSERIGALHTKHGNAKRVAKTREYLSYRFLVDRCTNENDKDWANYGGRGIQCKYADFPAFLADVGERPSPKHSIDRIDVNGHYEPGNVRWATRKEQNRNKTNSVKVTVRGVTYNLADYCDEHGISRGAAYQRYKTGWCDECIVLVRIGAPKDERCTHREKA